MSVQMPAARPLAFTRYIGCLNQILTAAIAVCVLGMTSGAAQEVSSILAVERQAVPTKAGEAAVSPPQAGPVAATDVPAPSSERGSAPKGQVMAPGLIPPPDTMAKKPHDLSPMGMFLTAGPVVQAVMIVLSVASVVTWIILLARGADILLAKRRITLAIVRLRKAGGLADASALVTKGVAARLLLVTDEEVFKSQGLPNDGIKERALMALQRVEAGAARRMASGTGVLATIGSIGPFVGLLGTVWGIMGSFIGIAESNTTSLAVVAPGIAEALLATGVGLAAAIPAVVIYNALARSITGYRAMLADAVALIMIHLSRDLDRRETPSSASGLNLRLAAE